MTVAATSGWSETLLLFTLAQVQYGLPISQVQEVLPRATLTHLPEAPASLVGILNLRGSLLPIIDLRQRLGLPCTTPQISQRIIVVSTDRAVVGVLVDAVQDLVSVAVAAPLAAVDTQLIHQIIEAEQQIVVVINATAVAGADVTQFLASTLPAGQAPPAGDTGLDRREEARP